MRGLVTVTCGSVLWASLVWTTAWGQTPKVPSTGLEEAAREELSTPETEETRRGGRPEQPGPAGGFPPLAGPIDPATYRLGPGDVLSLQMWGRVTRSLAMQVGPEGNLIVPGSGTLLVNGRTLAEVRSQMLEQLRALFRGVNLDVRLASPRSFVIFLTGEVTAPGPIVVTGTNRVSDVLARGLIAGSHRRIQVRHTDGARELADLELFLRTGDGAMNPWLRDGDVIHVPAATEFVHSQGGLASPAHLELGVRDSLLTLLRMSGGALPGADTAQVLFMRWKDPVTLDSLWISLADIGSGRFNPPLRAGDRLYVYYLPKYQALQQVAISGEVQRPGSYPIAEGRDRFSDLIQRAGGFLPTADLSSMRVHRTNPRGLAQDPEFDRLVRLSRDQLTSSEYEKLRTKLAGLREDYRIDWKRLQSAPARLDLLLRDGDLVTVDRQLNSVRVDGEVRRPGFVTYEPGRPAPDYIRQAGGLTNRAWNGRIRVTRAVTGQTLMARNVKALDPGDFVWVPERPDKTIWDYTREILTAASQAAAVVVLIRAVD